MQLMTDSVKLQYMLHSLRGRERSLIVDVLS